MKTPALIFRFRVAMVLFIAGLVISGVTAFPLLFELRILANLLAPGDQGTLAFWILKVRDGLEHTYARYPWVAYGTDWLAFGHLVIAMFFVGPLIHPLSSRTNIITGIVACVSIFPLAMICGPLREIPLGWQMIDCSFGLIGVVPLVYCLRLLKRLEMLNSGGEGHE
ncbi:MAG: hypothetical protein ABI600_14865 [Luteolibacter sp.]